MATTTSAMPPHDGPSPPPNDSMAATVTTVETRTDLSLLYKVLRTIIKPMRPNLASPPKKSLPRGSVKLSRDAKIQQARRCDVVERQDEFGLGLWLYDFIPKSRVQKQKQQGQHQKTQPQASGSTVATTSTTTTTTGTGPRHRVLFFNGGGFQAPPSPMHWELVANLAAQFPAEYQFTLVSYPMAPKSPAAESLPLLREYLRRVITASAEVGGSVSLMGDSAGGNIAISLGMWWATQLEEAAKRRSNDGGGGEDLGRGVVGEGINPIQPGILKSVVAISPVVDMQNTNPEIDALNKLDPILTKDLIERVAAGWSGTSKRTTPVATTAGAPGSSASTNPPSSPNRDSPQDITIQHKLKATTTNTKPLSRDDPAISPLCHEQGVFASLAKHEIHVHGIIGTNDCLAPDALLFKDKCVKAQVPGRWLVWEGQMHCFALAGVYRFGLKEGVQAIKFVEDVLRTEEKRR